MQSSDRNKDLEPDSRFTDEAWQEMSGLLDKEMPVAAADSDAAHKKRYLILFLFFLGFSTGLASWLTDLYRTTDFSGNSTEAYKECLEPPADADRFSSIETVASLMQQTAGSGKELAAEKQFADNAQNASNTNNAISNAAHIISNKTIGQVNKQKVFYKTVQKNTENITTVVPSDVHTANDNWNKNTGFNPLKAKISPENTKIPAVELKNENRNLLAAFNPLAPLSASVKYPSNDQLNRVVYNDKQSIFKALIPDQLGVQVSKFGLDLNSFESFSAGLSLSYQLSPRVFFRTGLSFQRFAKDISYAYSENVNDIANTEGNYSYNVEHNGPFNNSDYINTGNTFSENLIIKTKYYQLNQLEYLSVPMVVSVYPSSFWSVSLGASFSRLMKNSGGILSPGIRDEAAEQALISELLQTELQKVNTSIVTGLGVRLHRNVALNLNYNFSLGDIIKEGKLRVTDGNNLNNNFELSLNCYLFGN